ncbi:hypothetical protein M231_05359 [Tremella mesenterica]|uniref:Uncharacterized protein n=1 Tax=Tremella mesenterica TaxID=5217 RepID=A0A4Q1BIC2_TREME|nr:hypothetical protein M231_05359 [Tremella mesenterica]
MSPKPLIFILVLCLALTLLSCPVGASNQARFLALAGCRNVCNAVFEACVLRFGPNSPLVYVNCVAPHQTCLMFCG